MIKDFFNIIFRLCDDIIINIFTEWIEGENLIRLYETITDKSFNNYKIKNRFINIITLKNFLLKYNVVYKDIYPIMLTSITINTPLIPKKQYYIKEIIFQDLRINDKMIENIIEKCPMLESISFSDNSKINKSIYLLIQKCRNIKKISFNNNYLIESDINLIVDNYSQLEFLEIKQPKMYLTKFKRQNNYDILSNIKKLKEITSLHLLLENLYFDSPSIRRNLISEILSNLPLLRELSIDYYFNLIEDTKMIEKRINEKITLEKLKISPINNNSIDKNYKLFPQFKNNISELCIVFNRHIGRILPICDKLISSIESLLKLKTLTFKNFIFFDDTSHIDFTFKNNSLEYFIIENETSISISELENISKNCNNLKKIEISSFGTNIEKIDELNRFLRNRFLTLVSKTKS